MPSAGLKSQVTFEEANPTLQSIAVALGTAAADGSEWDKQLAHTNLFTSHEQLEQLKDNRLRNELRRVIRAIPAIAEADVIWARSKTRSAFSSRPKVTATVNVTPREGHDLTHLGGKVLSLAGSNLHFHAASDRWPGNVNVSGIAAISRAVARWVTLQAG